MQLVNHVSKAATGMSLLFCRFNYTSHSWSCHILYVMYVNGISEPSCICVTAQWQEMCFFPPKWFLCVRALLSTSSCIIYSKHHCFSFTVTENLTGKNIKIIFFPACACTCLCICVYLSAWEGNKKENRAGICLWCRNALFSTPLNRSNTP